MNTEPPEGDDLHRMLVSMKQNVLERATPRPKRRGRRAGIAIGIVGVLLLGAAGGGVALGLIPTSLTADPAPTATTTPEPTQTETPSGAPVIGRPTPTPTPTPTSTRPPYSLSDPGTWTISGDEVGPIALGGQDAVETDDLAGVFTADTGCLNPNVTFWVPVDPASPWLTVVRADDGTVQSIQIGNGAQNEGQRGPTTVQGIGVGSTLAEVRAAFPDARYTEPGNDTDAVPSDSPYGGWTTTINGVYVSFRVPPVNEEQRVDGVWVSTTDQDPPTEFCG